MRRPLLRTAVATLPLLAASLLMPAAQAATVNPVVWNKGSGGERYVALGDSFAAGPSIKPERACMGSEKNYARLLATHLDVKAFSDASCSAATTKNFTQKQTLLFDTNPAQFDALKSDTTLVTLGTIGGNDIGLVQLASSCITANCVPAAGADPLAAKFAEVRTSLTNSLAEVKRRSPKATVLMVGYGTYLLPGGCVPVKDGVTGPEADYMQGQIDRLSDIIGEVAKAGGAIFVDQRKIPHAIKHTSCAAPNKQWVRGTETYSDGALLHPSACGMDATFQHINRVLAEARGKAVPAFKDTCVAAGPAGPEEPEPEPTDEPTTSPSPTPSPSPTTTPSPEPTTPGTGGSWLQSLTQKVRDFWCRVSITNRC